MTPAKQKRIQRKKNKRKKKTPQKKMRLHGKKLRQILAAEGIDLVVKRDRPNWEREGKRVYGREGSSIVNMPKAYR